MPWGQDVNRKLRADMHQGFDQLHLRFDRFEARMHRGFDNVGFSDCCP